MRLINDTLLRDTYDAIVVGAGLGGMTGPAGQARPLGADDRAAGQAGRFLHLLPPRRRHVRRGHGHAVRVWRSRGFKPFRFLINELEEPVEVVAHSTLARMTFEGQPITFWPDVERFLQEELDQLYLDEKEGFHAFYRDLYKMYENIVLNEVIVPPSEFSAPGISPLMTGPLQMLKMQKLLDTSVRSLLDRYFKGEEITHFFDKLCSAYCYTTSTRPRRCWPPPCHR